MIARISAESPEDFFARSDFPEPVQDIGHIIAIRQSETILARSWAAGEGRQKSATKRQQASVHLGKRWLLSPARLLRRPIVACAQHRRHTNPRLSSASYGVPLSSQIFNQLDFHLGRCLKRH
jgi:hypothetical protein